MQRPSYLVKYEPLESLCLHFNVRPTRARNAADIGPTFDMLVIHDAHMPTHVLAATQPDLPNDSPLMLPIDSTRFEQGFHVDLNFPPTPPGTTAPIPRLVHVGDKQVLMVALPVIHISVPHVNSLPLLLLYGMNVETEHNILAWRLLPVNVVEEFPNAGAMALILSRLRDDKFENTFRFNHGIWKNILSLALNDTRIVQLVQTAWNVTADARKVRHRTTSQRH